MANRIKICGGGITVKEESNTLGGWGLQFNKIDSDNQYFGDDTDYRHKEGETVTLDVHYRHGRNPLVKFTKYCEATLQKVKEGWEVISTTAWDFTKPHASDIWQMVKEGKLKWSTGAGHIWEVVKESSGVEKFTLYKFNEISLTEWAAEQTNFAVIKEDSDLDKLTDPLDEIISKKENASKEMYAWSVPSALRELADLLSQSNTVHLRLDVISTQIIALAGLVAENQLYPNSELTYTDYISEILKSDATKEGKSISKTNLSKAQSIHDNAMALGAVCDKTAVKEVAESDETLSVENAKLKQDLVLKEAAIQNYKDLNEKLSGIFSA